MINKSSFELILGLEEEFAEAASQVIGVIRETGLIVGLDLVETEIMEKRSLLKILCNIGKKGTHMTLDADEVEKMKNTIRMFEHAELKLTTDGKILLENNEDVGRFVKLLNDYYKQGVVSGKYYGTNSGSPISSNGGGH